MTLGLFALQSLENDPRLRTVLDSIFAQRAYRWREPALDPLALLRRAWAWLTQTLASLSADSPALYHTLIASLVVVLALIFAHAGYVMWRTMRGATAREVELGSTRYEARDARWYAGEAERLAREGRYAEAMQADFLRLVLELDARQLVRFHPSRTPNEYAREPALSPGARRELASLVRRLYAYVFARVPCGPAELEEWRAHASVDRYATA